MDSRHDMSRYIAALIVVAPFLLGLNRPLPWVLWALCVVVALVMRPQVITAGSSAERRVLLPALLFALALPLLQLAGGACTVLPSTLPCAVNPEQVWLSLALAVLLLGWFLLLGDAQVIGSDRLLAALALAGGAQAIYGFACFHLGATPLFMDQVFRHDTVPAGGFPNRNHFAAFLYVSIFAAIALVLRLPGDTGSGRAARWRVLLDRRMLWRLLIVLMVLALIASRSRAGNAAFVAGLLAGAAWLWLVERRRGHHGLLTGRWRFVSLVIASVLLLDALLIGSFVGLDKLRERIGDTTLEAEIRSNLNDTVLAHPQSFTAAGHGSGSFHTLFERMKPETLPARFGQAHNDYLQVLMERGWIGALLLMAAMALALRGALVAGQDGDGAPLRFAFVSATVALLLHAGVEYVTQVPAIWMAWLLLLALCLRRPAKSWEPSGNRRAGRA